MNMIDYIIDKNNSRVVVLDNGKEIGECVYIKNNSGYNIVHTRVETAYQGRGIARKMVDMVLELARGEKKPIIADCSYARKVIEKNNK